uniref:Serine/threonine protein phosphatase 7 long form isogeny n=1 Tax=Cajanus cajan TaxID=3821 RepID=A0A151T1F7_CAJCA|nr:Serine/threonine protein phosphatase 7 long form isogeny [Cajanus cajan]
MRNEIDGIPHQIVPLLDHAGFGWIARLSYIKVSPSLLTALVERWRPETRIRIWGSVIPLLSLCICEWHQPDRVMRQFGCQQPIPNPPMTPAHVHALTLRGKTDDDWTTILSPALEHWANQYAYHFAPTPPQVGLLGPNSEYMRWYRRKGKLYIDPDGVKDSIVVCAYYNSYFNILFC